MRRRTITLAAAILLSLALVLAAGIYVREAVLRPLGLQEGTDPASLPLRLLKDGELRETVLNSLSTRASDRLEKTGIF